MHFGFSYVGFLFLLMLMAPNLIWSRNRPADYAAYAKRENKKYCSGWKGSVRSP